MKTLQCFYCISGTFRLETDVGVPRLSSQWPKNVGYLWFCKEKLKDGLPTIEEMQQIVHLRVLSSASRHAKQTGMKTEEFLCVAIDAFNRADLRHQGIDGFTGSANNHVAQQFVNKEESTDHDGIRNMKCILNENTRRGTVEP